MRKVVKSMLSNLKAEMARYDVDVKSVAQVIGKTERATKNRINGKVEISAEDIRLTMLPSAFTVAFSTSAFQSWGVKSAMGALVDFTAFRKPIKALRCILRLSHSASMPFSLFSSSVNRSVIP